MDREPRAGDVDQARVDHQVDVPLLELPRELPQRLARQLRVGDDRHHVRLAGLHRPEDGAEPAAVRAVRVDAYRPEPLDAAGAQPVEERARLGSGPTTSTFCTPSPRARSRATALRSAVRTTAVATSVSGTTRKT